MARGYEVHWAPEQIGGAGTKQLNGIERHGRGHPVRQSKRLTVLAEPYVLQEINTWIADRRGTPPSRSEAARMLLLEQLRTSSHLRG